MQSYAETSENSKEGGLRKTESVMNYQKFRLYLNVRDKANVTVLRGGAR
jgi:hypothetical protein